MSYCRTLRSYFLLALCIATMIAGQSFSRVADNASPESRQEVHHYSFMAAQVFCVPNGFTHQSPGVIAPDNESFLRFITPLMKRQIALPPVCAYSSSRSLWHGPPPLRSPPFLV
ncbi:hypothetical protein LJC46_01810 [Desulfovibrio sp. OttesenSCG-928-G15]|nr:hypothetical protein [Desulfovibrio sp. OttesenSCG-928-G15]